MRTLLVLFGCVVALAAVRRGALLPTDIAQEAEFRVQKAQAHAHAQAMNTPTQQCWTASSNTVLTDRECNTITTINAGAVLDVVSTTEETTLPCASGTGFWRVRFGLQDGFVPSDQNIGNPSSAATCKDGDNSAANLASAARCPTNMVLVTGVTEPNKDPYDTCIDQFEAYLVTVDPTTSAETVYPFNNVPKTGVTYQARVAAGVKPQGHMSMDDSKKACVAAGKRLCTMEEWRWSCQGGAFTPKGTTPPSNAGTTYPYGNTFVKGRCNIGRPSNPVVDVFGANPTYNYNNMNDPRLLMLPNTVANAGQYTGCVSTARAFDMAGSMDEWVYDKSRPAGYGTFLGGFFVDGTLHGEGCTYITTAHYTTWRDYSLGFRCCKDPTAAQQAVSAAGQSTGGNQVASNGATGTAGQTTVASNQGGTADNQPIDDSNEPDPQQQVVVAGDGADQPDPALADPNATPTTPTGSAQV